MVFFMSCFGLFEWRMRLLFLLPFGVGGWGFGLGTEIVQKGGGWGGGQPKSSVSHGETLIPHMQTGFRPASPPQKNSTPRVTRGR